MAGNSIFGRSFPIRPWIGRPLSGAVNTNVGVVESVTATDVVSVASADLVGSVVEAQTLADVQSNVGAFVASVSESGTASDTVFIGFATAITETASAVDTASATQGFSVQVSESVSAVDVQSVTTAYVCSIAEAANATDATNTPQSYTGSVAETVTATDLFSFVFTSGAGGHGNPDYTPWGAKKPPVRRPPVWDRGGKIEQPKPETLPPQAVPLPPASIFAKPAPTALPPVSGAPPFGLPSFNNLVPPNPGAMGQRMQETQDMNDALAALAALANIKGPNSVN